MLVLSRKKSEGVYVGPEIRVTVVAIMGDRVKLGFEAPNGTTIWRDEIVKAAGSVPPARQKVA